MEERSKKGKKKGEEKEKVQTRNIIIKLCS